ncbi:MAG TPA: hypothetical protein VIK18_15980 [Pirellulales bacterium]
MTPEWRMTSLGWTASACGFDLGHMGSAASILIDLTKNQQYASKRGLAVLWLNGRGAASNNLTRTRVAAYDD